MKQAEDYNPEMTPLIEKYGEMLLEEQKLINISFIPPETTRICQHEYLFSKHENVNLIMKCNKCGATKIKEL